MRVPIENGLGFFNQVSDFIKLPVAVRVYIKDHLISNFPVVISSSPLKTRYI